METITLFRLEDLLDDPGRRRIVGEEGRFGPVTEGREIEGQFRCPVGYVLLLTEDAPYDEGLNILLLDSAYDLLDQIEIGISFTPGVLENLVPNPDQLCFEMFGYRWVLKVHTMARRWPNYRPPPGARRPLRKALGQRYIELKRTPSK